MVEDRGELRVLRVGAVDRFDSGERSRAVAENVPLIDAALEIAGYDDSIEGVDGDGDERGLLG